MGRLEVMEVNKVSTKASFITTCRFAQPHQFVTVAHDFLSTAPQFVADGFLTN